MHATVVCKMNQARSIFGQAVLAHIFPEHTFASTGVNAVDNKKALDEVIRVAEKWQVPLVKTTSTSLQTSRADILSSDLVICAEVAFKKTILELGYLGAITDFEKNLIDPSFLAIDPDGLAVDKINHELAKVAYACVRAFSKLVEPMTAHNILAIIPNGDSDSALALAHAQFEAKIRGAIVIDVDVRSPLARNLLSPNEIIYFDPITWDPDQFVNTAAEKVLTAQFENSEPEAIFLTLLWRQKIRVLAQQRPIILITAPRYIKSSRLLDSYLAAIPADEISTIAS